MRLCRGTSVKLLRNNSDKLSSYKVCTTASAAFVLRPVFLQKLQNTGAYMEDVTDPTHSAPLWRDFMGVMHACRSEDLNEAFLRILTLCDRRVPPNAKYALPAQADVTCALCNVRQRTGQKRVA